MSELFLEKQEKRKSKRNIRDNILLVELFMGDDEAPEALASCGHSEISLCANGRCKMRRRPLRAQQGRASSPMCVCVWHSTLMP